MKNELNQSKRFANGQRILKFKNNISISPIRKKGNAELQINNKNTNLDIDIINNKTDKVAIIPIVLPRINSPSLKGNFNTRKINLGETANNFSEVNNINSNKNIRASLKAYK